MSLQDDLGQTLNKRIDSLDDQAGLTGAATPARP